MTGRPTPADPLLREFVQGTLGCGCPEEVFQRVETAPITWGGVRGRRITVGARDEEGLNRVRIVIAASDPPRMAPAAEAAFAQAPGHDDRSHLHVVDRRSCAWEGAL